MLVSRENLFNKISKVFPFNLSSPEKIKTLVEKSEVVFFEEGNFVYMEGAFATNFYVIYEGELEILVEEHHSLRKLNTLHDGNYFGEDVLKQAKERTSTARVLKNALLIRIPKKILDDFINEKAELRRAFALISKTYTRLFELKFRDLSPETVYFIGNPHYFILLSKLFLTVLIMLLPSLVVLILKISNVLSNSALFGVSALLAVIFLLQLAWHYFEWRNDFYLMTGKRVINLYRNLVNFESKFEIPLSAINNLEIKKSVLGRYYGFGNLIIRTYTGETLLKSVSSASEVQILLELLMGLNKTSKRIEERKSFERIVDNRLQMSKDNLEFINKQDAEDGGTSEDNSGFSRIIYRTHWLILLKKVLFPSLLILSIILLLTFFTANKMPLIKSNPGMVFTGSLLIGAFMWWVYQYFDWRNDQYHITNSQIIDIYRKPFGSEDRRTASIQNIQSIRFERKGILGLLLNFGTVYIRVGDEEFTFDNVPDPARIQERLFNVLEMSINQMKKSELTDQQQRLAEWIDAYHQIREKTQKET